MIIEDISQEEYEQEIAFMEANVMHFNSPAEASAYLESIDEYEDINDFENPEELMQAIEEGMREFQEYVHTQK